MSAMIKDQELWKTEKQSSEVIDEAKREEHPYLEEGNRGGSDRRTFLLEDH